MIDKKLTEFECTGCKMCKDVCPKDAISFRTNTDGYWYPSVDYDKCVSCGICQNKCPSLSFKNEHKSEDAKVYAAWSKNDEIRRKSTSGGLYYEFAKYIIDNGGYIAGSVYEDDFKGAYHTVSNTYDGLLKIMGSKYFQSDTEGIYRSVKNLLDKNNVVLFTGTPCQNAALISYLGKEYDNLITCEFICRGNPSPMVHRKKLEYFEKKYNSKIVSFQDKQKKYGWSYFGELVRFENGKELYINRYKDWANQCFIRYNYNLRESCYQCPYKGSSRVADLTIADFWGITDVSKKDLRDGVSALITCSPKGEAFINNLQEQIYMQRRAFDEVVTYNRAVIESAAKFDGRSQFFEDISNMNFHKAISKNHKMSFVKRNKEYLKTKVKRVLSEYAPVIKNAHRISWIKFFKYNFLSKKIKRDKYSFLIPCHGSKIQLSKTAKIYLKSNLLLNYYPCYPRIGLHSVIKMGENAVMHINNQVEIGYGNIISVASGAKLIFGRLFTGMNVNIICNSEIYLGNYVMLGRNVCIYDSDYHSIFNENYIKKNEDRKVEIGDNCWIGANSIVLKGSTISNGAIISAAAVVSGKVCGNHVYVSQKNNKSLEKTVFWRR